MKLLKIVFLGILSILLFAQVGDAAIKQLKVYRKAFPEFKPKCTYCHIDAKPKKGEGKNDLNAYGLKLLEAMGGEALTTEMLESIGNHETFEASSSLEGGGEVEVAAKTEATLDEVVEGLEADVNELEGVVEEVVEDVDALKGSMKDLSKKH